LVETLFDWVNLWCMSHRGDDDIVLFGMHFSVI